MSHSPRLLVFLCQSTACSTFGLFLWGGISLQCCQNSSKLPSQRTLCMISQSSVNKSLRTKQDNIGRGPDKTVYFHLGMVSWVCSSYQMINRQACTIELWTCVSREFTHNVGQVLVTSWVQIRIPLFFLFISSSCYFCLHNDVLVSNRNKTICLVYNI